MSRLRFPHPFALLVGCVLVAAILTHVLPVGQYQRRDDPATGRKVVVAGSYAAVAAKPVGPFETLVAIPKGMADAGSVIFLLFLVGGALTVVDKTGALREGVAWLARRLGRRESLILPASCVVFATGGALDGMFEEVIAFIPALLVLTRRMGFDGLTAVAMSLGAAGVGGAFSPMNPFNVGISQKLAELPLLSGSLFRLVVLAAALAIWTWGTMRYAVRTRTAERTDDATESGGLSVRHATVLLAVVGAFGAFVFGVVRYGWGFDQMSALFFLMGIAAGLVGGLGVTGTAEAYVEGFKSMAFAALLIGVARAIYLVLDQGRIVDTIIHGLVTPLAHLPVGLFAVGMTVVQAVISVPVPSGTGQSVLTMPILVPLSDLLGLSRQVTVLAFQYGNGVVGQITPTGGALLAILAAAGVRYEHWLKFAIPLCLALFALSLAAIGVAVAIGLK